MNDLPNLCMFCGREIEPQEMSAEHFVPKCLWEKKCRPDRTRTVPAHKSCNSSFSDDNDYFRNVLVLEEGAVENCEAARIVSEQTVERMIQKRPGTIIKAAKNFRERPVMTASGIYVGEKPAFEVDVSRITRVLFNVMKGIFYVTQKVPMPQNFEPEVYDTNLLDPAPFRRTVEAMVDWQSFGDDAFQCRYVLFGKPAHGMACLMRFYNHREFYGVALSPQLVEEERNRDVFVPSRPDSPILVPRHIAEN